MEPEFIGGEVDLRIEGTGSDRKTVTGYRKEPICNPGVLCGTDRCVQKNCFTNICFFTAKWCVGTKWNKQKIELGNHKVGETEECKYWSMQMPVR